MSLTGRNLAMGASALAVLSAAGLANAGPAPREKETPLYPDSAPQERARAVYRADGTWVAAWSQGRDIVAQIFLPDGTPARTLIAVHPQTPQLEVTPALGMDADGNFVVVWWRIAEGIYARRFDAQGEPLGDAFVVEPYDSSAEPESPDAAMAPDGRFVVVWERSAGSYTSVHARLYDATGRSLGPASVVEESEPNPQRLASVAMHGDGSFVVAYESNYYEPDGRRPQSVYIKGFDASGGVRLPKTLAHDPPTAEYYNVRPALAMDADGAFQLTWFRSIPGSPQNVLDVLYRRFDPSGIPRGPAQKVNTGRSVGSPLTALGVDAAGAATVLFVDGDEVTLLARSYDRFGNADGEPYVVSTGPTGNDLYLDPNAVAFDADGRFVVLWNRGNRYTGGPVSRRLYEAPREGAPPPPPPPPPEPEPEVRSGEIGQTRLGGPLSAWALLVLSAAAAIRRNRKH